MQLIKEKTISFSAREVNDLVDLVVLLPAMGVHLAAPLQQLQQQAQLGHLLLALLLSLYNIFNPFKLELLLNRMQKKMIWMLKPSPLSVTKKSCIVETLPSSLVRRLLGLYPIPSELL